MNKIIKVILGVWVVAGLSVFLAFQACNTHSARDTGVDAATLQKNDLWNKRQVDSAVSMLRSGYLVLRMGLGTDSYMFSQMNRKDKTYSHCGIVIVEHGYPFVYHSIGGEDNPDERLRRDSASFFFSPQHNISLAIVSYNLDAAKTNALTAVVNKFYQQRPKFDMKFDLATDDKLYCTEFIYKVLNRTMNDNNYIKATTFLGRTFVGTDDLFVNSHANIIWRKKFK